MKKQIMLQDLLYVNEHISCKKYMVDATYGFHYVEIPIGTDELNKVLECNVIIFIIEGSCSFNCNQFSNKVFSAGDMLFLPKSAIIDATIIEDAKFMYMAFDIPLNPCDKQSFDHLWETCKMITYDFAPLKMNYPMSNFINSLVYYLKNGGSCIHIHEIKHKEFFLILRWFYTKEQFATFFYPIIGKSFDFKNFVLDNYAQCDRLEELIKRSNMSPNTFMKKFKTEFGVTAYQWMLKQMCQKILHKVSQSGATVKDVMIEIGVDSPTHFNRICKRHFNKTPKELISFYQSDI